jgi:Na+-translocating ferredoxin:NAD+ oxidoreductase RnfD subunit
MANIGKSLEGFAAKTPYSSYANFLKSTAIPNAEMFGNMIRSSELLVGIALVLGGIVLLWQKRLPMVAIWLLALANFGGALMNLNFFLAAGWSSPSTWGVNLVMGLIHLVFGIYFLANRRELAS